MIWRCAVAAGARRLWSIRADRRTDRGLRADHLDQRGRRGVRGHCLPTRIGPVAGPTGLGLILVVAGITWFGHLGRAFVRLLTVSFILVTMAVLGCAVSATPQPTGTITTSADHPVWAVSLAFPVAMALATGVEAPSSATRTTRQLWATPVRAGHPMADPGHRRQPDHLPGGGRDPPADRGAARELHPYRRTRPGRRTATTLRRVPTAGREPHPRRPTSQPRRITDHRREPVLGVGKAGRPAASPQGSPPPGPTSMETLRNPDDHPGNGAVRRWTSARLANPLDRGAAFSSRWARCSECSAPPDTQLANDSTGTDQPSRRDRTASEPTRPVQLDRSDNPAPFPCVCSIP